MTLAPEDQLLLACSRSFLTASDADRAAAALDHDLDWSYVMESSIRHAVAPLLWHALGQLDASPREDRVPPAVAEELSAIHHGSGVRSRRLLGIVGDIISVLEPAGIPVLGLKDVILGPQAYADPGLRPMGDVDLLVHRDDFTRAANLLATLGFEPVPDRDRPFTRRYAGGQQQRRASDETWIDLQWHVAEREWDRHGDGAWSFDTDGMWERAVPFEIAGRPLLAPSPADMLLHLCLHLEGHRYCELVLFADLVEFLRHHGEAFDWDACIARVRAARSESSVHHALLLAQRLLHLALPADVLDELRAPYFEAPLFAPLFESLTPLHGSIDDLAHVARDRPEATHRAEELTRVQAASASAAYAEIDALLRRLRARGRGPVAVDGDVSPRRFPDPLLPAFAPVEIFTVVDDLAALTATLDEQGFAPAGATRRVKVCHLDPHDPAVHERIELFLTVELSIDVARAFGGPATAPSNRDVAVQSLSAHLRGRHPTAPTVPIVVHALRPPELVAALAGRLGADPTERLFRGTVVAAAAADLPSPVAPGEVLEVAARHHRTDDVVVGLAVAQAFGVLTDADLTARPHVLEWARYQPSALDRRPELRGAYLAALALFSLGGAGERVRYLTRAVAPGGVALRAVATAASGAARRMAPGRAGRTVASPSARDFAYWLETAS